jgi:glycosyltransferase involved in cell wall biosynthesis
MSRKIAFFMSNYSVGGAERQYECLINTISREQFDVHVVQISHRSSRPTSTSYRAAKVKTFEMRNKHDIGMLFAIARYIRTNRIELIQSQLFMDNQIARAVGFLSGCPVITSVRGGPTLGRVRTRIEHGFQWMSKRVVVNSSWLKGILVKDGVNPDKIVVIHNGIDPDRFHTSVDRAVSREKFGINASVSVVGIVARLHPMKDHRTFFDVVRLLKERIPDVQAVVVGGGSLRSELESYVDETGIRSNVRFLGTVTTELPEVLGMFDVLLFTSRWGESLPNVLLEASAAGIPVVATSMHGVPEIIEDGVNGYLAEIGDVSRLAERVEILLANREMRERFASNARDKLAKFTVHGMVRKYEELYMTILGDPAKA